MIAFDTNYLIRHLVSDHPSQCKIVRQTIAAEVRAGGRVMLYDIILCETTWVLESVYGADREDILTALRRLQNDPAFEFEYPERVRSAIRRFESGKAEFSDYLIAEISRERQVELRTFDKRLKRELN